MEHQLNRVLDTWKSWEERLKDIQKVTGNGKDFEHITLKLKLRHFQENRHLIGNSARKDEKAFLPLLEVAIEKLEKQVYPNFIKRWIYKVKDALIDGPAFTAKVKARQLENIAVLKEQLIKAGFGNISGNLETILNGDQEKQTVLLSSQIDSDRSLNVALHFEKDTANIIHFTSVDSALKNNFSNEKAPSFPFKLEEWPGLTAQHIKNLLEGRVVRQQYTDITGSVNSRWLELDPHRQMVRKYDEHFGYDIQKIIGDLPLGDYLQDGKRSLLMEKLEQGQNVLLRSIAGDEVKGLYIQVNPSARSVNITDESGKPVTRQDLQDQANRFHQKTAVIKKLPVQPASDQKKRNRKQMIS